MRDFALICGDGAIKGGFVAGAVTRLLEKYPREMENVKIITASSASVGSMCYYISHLHDHPGREIWMTALSSKSFISFSSIRDFYRAKPIYDIEYMAENVFRTQHPLDVEKILSSPISFFFPIYNVDLCQIEVFSNRDAETLESPTALPYVLRPMRGHDLYQLIRAANSAPFVYDRPVKIGDYHYIDAAAWVPQLLEVPGIKDVKKLIIVTKFDYSFRRRLNYWALGFLFPLFIAPFKKYRLPNDAYFQYGRKPGVIRAFMKVVDVLKRHDRLFLISPLKRLGALTDNSAATLESNFRHGMDLVDANENELGEFFRN